MPEVATLSPYLVGGLTVVGIIAYSIWARRSAPGSGHDARYYADRQDPQRYWVQAVLAVYRGDVGDPAYWDPEDACREIQQGWSTPDRNELLALIQRYVAGECTPAFDHVRIIWLARLGAGAGWLDEATSWGYALQAKSMLQYGYTGWPALAEGIDQPITRRAGADQALRGSLQPHVVDLHGVCAGSGRHALGSKGSAWTRGWPDPWVDRREEDRTSPGSGQRTLVDGALDPHHPLRRTQVDRRATSAHGVGGSHRWSLGNRRGVGVRLRSARHQHAGDQQRPSHHRGV